MSKYFIIKIIQCLVRSTNPKSMLKFTNAICVNSIYILIQREKENEPGSFNITVSLDENKKSCQYITENSYSHCGQSSIEDCRQCKRSSCSTIQCGAKVGNQFVN